MSGGVGVCIVAAVVGLDILVADNLVVVDIPVVVGILDGEKRD